MQLANMYNYEVGLNDPESRKYFEASLSDNTKRTFFSGLRHFERWGGTLPASKHMICMYLRQHAKKHKISTLKHRLSIIKMWHKIRNYADPTDCPEVKHLFNGIQRVHIKPVDKAKPLTYETLLKINEFLSKKERLVHLRNLAIIMIGFFGAFRCSELVLIEFKDLNFTSEGVEIYVFKSKMDQVGKGEVVAIPYGNDTICPVKTLLRWLKVSEIKEGPIFVQLKSNNRCQYKGITPQVISLLLKKIIKSLGMEEFNTFYSSHSLRRGFATQASQNGSSIASIMRQGRWKSYNSVMGYIDEGTRFQDNASSKILES